MSPDEGKERRENRRAVSQLEQSGEQLTRNKRRRDYKVETRGLNENLAGKKFQFKLDSTGWRGESSRYRLDSRGCSLFSSLDPSAIFPALDVALVSQKFRNTG